LLSKLQFLGGFCELLSSDYVSTNPAYFFIERHYNGVAERFCITRSSILNECLNINKAECEELMVHIYMECDNDNLSEEGSLINETSFKECSEKEFLAYVESKGIDSESECTL